MAKILPQGSNVNLNLEDPYSKLMNNLNVISKLQNISNTAKTNRANRDSSFQNNLTLVNGLISRAENSQDLDYAQNILGNLTNNSDNPNLEILQNITNQNLVKSKVKFDNILSLGNDIGNTIYKKHEFWSDTNTVNNLSVNEMNTTKQIIDYYASISNDKDALGNITSELDKIKIFESELAATFTANKKIPGMKFNDENGQPVSYSEFKLKLKKHKDRLLLFVETGFNDGVINEQEASFILRGDRAAYDNKRKERNQNYKYLSNVDSNKIKNIDKNINDLAEIDNDGWISSLSDPTNPAAIELGNEMINDKGFITAVFDYFKGNDNDNDIQISGDAEVDKNTVLNKFSKEGKLETIAFLNDYKKNAVAERDKNALAARSWGIGWYGSEPSLSDWSNNKKTLKKSNIYEGETEEVSGGDLTTLDYGDYGEGVSEESVPAAEEGATTAEISLDKKLTDKELTDINNLKVKKSSGVRTGVIVTGITTAIGASIHLSDEISNAVKNVTDNVKGLVISKEKVKDFIVDKKGVVADFNKKLDKIDVNLKKEFESIDKKIEIEKEKVKNINPKNSNNVSKDRANAQKRQKQLENSKVGKQNTVDIKKEKIKTNFIKTYAKKNNVNIKNVEKLLDPSVNAKWEKIAKLKDKFSKKFKKFGKLSKAGSYNYLAASGGAKVAEMYGYNDVVGQLVGAGTGVTAKIIGLKFVNKNAKKLIKSQIYKTVKNKISASVANKAVTSFAGFAGGPLIGIGTSILGAGLLLKDVYDISQILFDNGTISQEEMDKINTSALEQERLYNLNKEKSTTNIQDSTVPSKKPKYDFSKFDK